MKLKILITIFLFVGSLNITAQIIVNNTYYRDKLYLNGEWQICVDPYDYYIVARDKRIAENYKAKDKTERVEYGFSNANTLKVPGDWNTQQEKLYYYEGTVWYKKEFVYEKKNNKKVVLNFEAVNYIANVYLNGVRLGTHEGGFTPFQFDCTEALINGNNSLVVYVNNERKKENVPALDFDWWNFGGITRSVYLIELPKTFIEDYSVQLDKNNPSKITGWVKLNNMNTDASIEFSIAELNKKVKLKIDSNGFAKFSLNANPKLWSPSNPKLYQVKIAASEDSIIDHIGFRTIETSGTKILLNKKPLFLSGICLHEETLFTGGRIISKEQVKTLFDYAKELNCNFIRLAHYPHSEDALKLADQMGLLVWAEVPVWQSIDFLNKHSAKITKQQLSEMVHRDKNRASIIMWSVSNETDKEKPGRLEFLKSMIDLARSMDSTRLITSALHRTQTSKHKKEIEDPLGNYLDVLAINEYLAWYGNNTMEDFAKMEWKTDFDKPHLISEFGAEAIYGFRADNKTIWSEDYQAELYKNQIKMFERIPFLTGTSPWILKDFRSPRRLNPDYQKDWNNKGLISNQGERKEAFYIMQEYYKTK